MVTISNIHIMQGKNGLFVSYPSSKSKTGEYAQLFQPINRYSGEMLGSAILNAYEDCVKTKNIRITEAGPQIESVKRRIRRFVNNDAGK